jgi:hypothetical protein
MQLRTQPTREMLMTANNGDLSSFSNGPNAPNNVVVPDSLLTVAVQALTAIGAEAQQAVKKLEGVPIPATMARSSPSTPAAEAPLRAAPAISPMDLHVSVPPHPVPPEARPTLASSVPSGPTAKSDQMKPGDVLHPGDSLTSLCKRTATSCSTLARVPSGRRTRPANL